jgi:hypothetical protein
MNRRLVFLVGFAVITASAAIRAGRLRTVADAAPETTPSLTGTGTAS